MDPRLDAPRRKAWPATRGPGHIGPAHWYTNGIGVTAMAHPRTIHDFGGFPQALQDMQYPAPGDPELARHICALLSPFPVILDETEWGLDHGVWSVLCKVFPAADVPVLQLSIDSHRTPQQHFDIGARLEPLRDEGVLVLGTGNAVHNLEVFRRYDENFGPSIDYARFGHDATLSVPSPDHYYPLLYVAGAAGADEATVEIDGVCQGSMSMLSVSYGA
jgi:4,5-DOPA dioxygenase extradiol